MDLCPRRAQPAHERPKGELSPQSRLQMGKQPDLGFLLFLDTCSVLAVPARVSASQLGAGEAHVPLQSREKT